MDLNLKNNEIISDFNVTIKRKKVWDKEIKLALWFDKICRCNHLKYSLYAGSLLGAIRHDGFIPWDDDMDFAMPRNDYERFLSIIKNIKTDNFFVDNFFTNKHAINGFTRIRDLNTTAFRSDVSNTEFPQYSGIFIDIFPLDNLPNNKLRRFFYVRKIWLLKRMVNNSPLAIHTTNLSIVRKLFIFIMKLYCKCVNPIDLFLNFDANLKKYAKDETCIDCSLLVFDINSKYIIERQSFNKLIEHYFFQYKFYIPENYDEILKKHYGNYHSMIKNTQKHEISFFDPDKSYISYKNKYLELIDKNFVDNEM